MGFFEEPRHFFEKSEHLKPESQFPYWASSRLPKRKFGRKESSLWSGSQLLNEADSTGLTGRDLQTRSSLSVALGVSQLSQDPQVCAGSPEVGSPKMRRPLK